MIYFVRHGESEANVAGVFAGQKDDTPLTKKGKKQAKQAAQQILRQKLSIDKVVSSKLLRARQTAEILANYTGSKPDDIEFDARVIEYDMGSLSGTPIRHVSSKELTSAQGAEDVEKFRSRVQSFLDEYRDSRSVVLLVSHAGVGRMIHAIDQNMPAADFYNLDPFPNASVNKID